MKKVWLVLPGYCVGLGGLMLITYRTILAVSSPGKMVLVSVNQFGEQYLDVVALGFLWMVCLVGVLCLVSLERELRRKEYVTMKHTTQSVYCPPFPSIDSLGSSYQSAFTIQTQGASMDFFPSDMVCRVRNDVTNRFSVSIVVSPEDFLTEKI